MSGDHSERSVHFSKSQVCSPEQGDSQVPGTASHQVIELLATELGLPKVEVISAASFSKLGVGFVFAIHLATQLRCKLGIHVQPHILPGMKPTELLMAVRTTSPVHDRSSNESSACATSPRHDRLSGGSSARRELPCLLGFSQQLIKITKSAPVTSELPVPCPSGGYTMHYPSYPSLKAALDGFGFAELDM